MGARASRLGYEMTKLKNGKVQILYLGADVSAFVNFASSAKF